MFDDQLHVGGKWENMEFSFLSHFHQGVPIPIPNSIPNPVKLA